MQTYIISTEAKDYIKIGKSIDVRKRLYELQTGNPHLLKLEGYFDCDIEDILHDEYKHHHKHLEWFSYESLSVIRNREGFIPYCEKNKTSHTILKFSPSSEYRNLILILKPCSQSLLLYILMNYYINNDKVEVKINKKYYMNQSGIKSNTTYLAAVEELLRYGFIGNTMYKTVYWINPILFSSGDRMTKYPDRIVEKGEL